MKLTIILIIVSVLSVMISCSPAQKESNQIKQVPVLPQNQEQIDPAAANPAQVDEEETASQPSPAQNNAEVMLNPRHGEPFHRCDIPVGAPLNSPPANTTRPATTNQVQTAAPRISGQAPTVSNNATAPTIENAMRMNSTQTRSASAPATGTKPSLNPPHGQPWHRCDIAVGSPLP